MGFLDAIFGSQLSTAKDPERWLLDAFGGTRTASGERITEQTALTCAALKSAVSLLAQTMGELPLTVHRRLPGGKSERVPDSPEWQLLHNEPNKETSSYIFKETLQGHLGTYGNGYAEIIRAGDGRPVELWQRSPAPSQTKPNRKDDGTLFYEIHDKHGNRGRDIRAQDMLHIPGFGFDGLVGYNPIRHLSQQIGSDIGATKFGAELYGNSLQPSGFVTIPGDLSEDAYNRTRKAFNPERVQGQRHRTGLLEGGSTYAQTSMSPGDVQMIESRRYGVEDIARAYHVPLQLLQDLVNGTAHASVVELGREFIIYTMDPWISRWEGEINRKVLGGTGLFVKFDTKQFLRGDHKARADFYLKVARIGVMTINEMRAIEDLPDIGPSGDVHFVSRDLVPLEFAAKEPKPAQPPRPALPPPTPTNGDEEQQSPLQPVSEQVKEQWMLRRAAVDALNEELSRMLRKEGKAAIRAASKPETMLSWIDEFYDSHAVVMAQAIEPALNVCLYARADLPRLSVFVRDHVSKSREDLLRATECKACDLSVNVAACIESWLQPDSGRFAVARSNVEMLVGDTGLQGTQGQTGTDGKDGKDGRDGGKGDKGDTGRDGRDGDPANVTVQAELKEPDRVVTHERDRNGLLTQSHTRAVARGT